MNKEESLTLLKIAAGVHLAFDALLVIILSVVAAAFSIALPRNSLIILLVVIGVLMAYALLSAIIMIGVLRQQGWSRVPALIIAALGLLSVPFGTVLGALLIWLLGFNEDVKRAFGA